MCHTLRHTLRTRRSIIDAFRTKTNFGRYYAATKSNSTSAMSGIEESRPVGAYGFSRGGYPGLTRPGLSNFAPLGLTCDFVAGDEGDQNRSEFGDLLVAHMANH